MDQELEHLYSPSRWSKRFDADVIVDKHVEFVTEESERVRSCVPNSRGLRYGPGEYQQYDLYGGDSLPPGAPLFVYIHGGYWQALDRHMSAYCVEPLVKAGLRVAIVGYTTAPKGTLEQMVEEIRTALQVIISQATDMGCRGVWVGGHSAGAHLASMAVLCDVTTSVGLQLVKGLVLISGIFHLAPLVRTYVNQPLKLDKERATKLSPLAILGDTQLTACARRMKIVLAVGEHDSPAFIQQTRDFATVFKPRFVERSTLSTRDELLDHQWKQFRKPLDRGSLDWSTRQDTGVAEALQGRVSSVEVMEIAGLDHFSMVELLSTSQHSLTKKIIALARAA